MTLQVPRPVLKGSKALVVGHRQRAFDRLRLREGVPRTRRRPRHHLPERQGAAVRRAAGALARSPAVPAARRQRRGRAGSGVRRDRQAVGPARHPRPLDRVRAEGRPAGRAHQLLGGRFREGDGRVVPFLRADGAARRAVDDERRDDVRDELSWRRQGDTHVQCHGSGEGRARSLLPLPRVRTGRTRAFASTRSRPVRSRRAPHPVSRTSTCCSPRSSSARRSASWSTSWTSASLARILLRPTRGGCRARRCMSTAASTSWRDVDAV